MSWEIYTILILLALMMLFFWLWRRASERHATVAFQKSSLSSKYGKMTEQFMPFLKDYPYDPQNFRFLGSPIDGIQFEEDKIILVEFKTANSRLSEKQRHIADLAGARRIVFEEHRLD
jgi:predicted Holliday junction resolvase-like endonuclease